MLLFRLDWALRSVGLYRLLKFLGCGMTTGLRFRWVLFASRITGTDHARASLK